MSSYHLYLEKNENLTLMQDFSRSNRAKIRVHKKPYVLEKGMILDIGGTKMYVKGVFPVTSKPKICDEFQHLNCSDVSYPYKNIFVGEKGHFNDEEAQEYEEDVKVTLEDFTDLYIRKADFSRTNQLKGLKKNPFVEFEILDGPRAGQTIKVEKNLTYQLEKAEKNQLIPKVKDEYIFGKGEHNDFNLKSFQAREYQCTIFFSDMYGWCIKDEKYFWDLAHNYIYLANYEQFKYSTPSNLTKVQNDMILCVGDYELQINIFNTEEDRIKEDIYDDEASLFHEKEDKFDIKF